MDGDVSTAVFIVEIVCSLPKDGFKDWEDMSEETKSLFNEGPIPCEGNSPCPSYCLTCRFCVAYEVDDY